MNARVKLARLAQYKKNVESAQDDLKQTEGAFNELNSDLQTAYERACRRRPIRSLRRTATPLAQEIKQLRDNVLAVGNTKVANRYLFGGYNTTDAPFTLDTSGNLLYNGLDVSTNSAAVQAEAGQNTSVEMGYDITMQTSTNGVELLGSGDSNVYNLLQQPLQYAYQRRLVE